MIFPEEHFCRKPNLSGGHMSWLTGAGLKRAAIGVIQREGILPCCRGRCPPDAHWWPAMGQFPGRECRE